MQNIHKKNIFVKSINSSPGTESKIMDKRWFILGMYLTPAIDKPDFDYFVINQKQKKMLFSKFFFLT